jgi:hypothetical protein
VPCHGFVFRFSCFASRFAHNVSVNVNVIAPSVMVDAWLTVAVLLTEAEPLVAPPPFAVAAPPVAPAPPPVAVCAPEPVVGPLVAAPPGPPAIAFVPPTF